MGSFSSVGHARGGNAYCWIELTILLLNYRLTEDYNLELQYRKPFADIWREEKDDPELGALSERMGVRSRTDGSFLVSDQEFEAASKTMFLTAWRLLFLKPTDGIFVFFRLLSRILLLQGLTQAVACLLVNVKPSTMYYK